MLTVYAVSRSWGALCLLWVSVLTTSWTLDVLLLGL